LERRYTLLIEDSNQLVKEVNILMCETRLLELALPKSFHCANLDDGSVSGTVLISKENIHTKKGDPLIMEMRSSIIKC
jgi:hypothetical protein